MKKNITRISIIAFILMSLSFSVGLINVYGFGEPDQTIQELRFQSGYGTLNPTGIQNLYPCSYPLFYTRVWNDPLDTTLTNVHTVVTLPRYFSGNSYDASSTNYGTKSDNVVINETDVDTIKWLQSANGLEMAYKPTTMYYNFGTDSNHSITPIVEYINDSNNQPAVRIKINGLPDLAPGKSVEVFWYMKVGGNCISASKALISNPSTTYNVGDKVDYQLNLTNNGDYPFQNIVVSDTFDANTFGSNVEVTSLDNPARTISNINVAGQILTFNVSGQLAKGQQTQVKLRFTVKPNFSGSSACNISGFVTYQDLQSLFNNRTDFTSSSSLCVPLYNPNPKLEVTKSLVSYDKANNKVYDQIVVKNLGDVVINNVVVTDNYDSTKLSLVDVKVGNTSVGLTSNNPGNFSFNINSLNIGAVNTYSVIFSIIDSAVSGQACNQNVSVSGVYATGATVTDAFNQPICIDYVKPAPSISVTKYLVNSSIAMLEYRVDVKNTGNTVMNSVKLTDTYDSSRLLLDSTVPNFNSNNAGVIVINNILGNGMILNPGDTSSVDVKFNVLANAPVGLACNLSAKVDAVDQDGRQVDSTYNVTQNIVNCVNLVVIVKNQPYFSITKRLVSNTDTTVGNMVEWEIVATNICSGDCTPANYLEFRDSFPSTNLTFSSAFAALKNADGSNVSTNPIQFNPTITTNNGVTEMSYANVVDLVGTINQGQYVVFDIYTTASGSSSSCVLNTGTVISSTNSVSASACVNIGEVKGVTTTVILPTTDGLDIIGTILSLPTNIQIALVLIILGLVFGTVIPSALLIKSKKIE